MTLIKPYTFTAGTKARADEVNKNFDEIYKQANINISDIEDINGTIDEIYVSKADVNGSSSQRFSVADPINAGEAVNKQTLTRNTLNTVDYIGGLEITTDSASPNDTIIVESGACYDYTKEIVLQLQNRLSKKNSTQSANSTYYVYIVGDNTGALPSIDIIISTESGNPPLPSGKTKYRLIGHYTTNSNNIINGIYHDSLNRTEIKRIASVMAVPDYSRRTSISTTSFTAPSDGVLYYMGKFSNTSFYVNVNGVAVALVGDSATDATISCVTLVLGAGDRVTNLNNATANTHRYFFPMKGV